MTEKPQKNTTGRPREVPEDIRVKQDPGYSKGSFLNALDRATRRLEQAFGRDRESSRTEE